MSNNKLSSGLEDYIEEIYIADINGKTLKGAELARKLNISRSSVSEALAKLVSKGLIKYESYGAISLTEIGISEAKRVYNKHNILKNFFETALNISPLEASENACKIEHIISQHLLSEIFNFTTFLNENPEILDKYKLTK